MTPDGERGLDEVVIITLKDVYVEVLRCKDISRDTQATVTTTATTVADHEVRIRGLERWRYALPTSLFVSAASIAVALIGLFKH